jgi:hypothetical protein
MRRRDLIGMLCGAALASPSGPNRSDRRSTEMGEPTFAEAIVNERLRR